MPETRKVVITPGEPAGIRSLPSATGQLSWWICADGALLTDRAKRLGLPLSLLPYDPRNLLFLSAPVP